jgi:PAS domain S-box-containing protein
VAFAHRVRTGTTDWAAGAVCAAVGLLMLTEPRQQFGMAEPYLRWLGALLLGSGSVFVLSMALRRRAPLAMGAQLLVGAELLGIGALEAPNRLLATSVSLGLLGLATIAAAFVPPHGRISAARRIDLFVPVAALAIVACGGVLAFVPPEYVRATALETGGATPWYAAFLIATGLAVAIVELTGTRRRILRALVALAVAAAFWSFIFVVAVPARSAIGSVVWAVAGLLAPAALWFGSRLRRLTRVSLRTRFAVLLAGVTAVAVMTAIGADARSDEAALTAAVLDQQQLVATSIAANLVSNSARTSVEEAVQTIDLQRRSLANASEQIYLLDEDGRSLASEAPTATAQLAEAIRRSNGPGTLEYATADDDQLYGFAPVPGAAWRVVAERSALESVTGVDESADYLIAMLMVGLAAVVGALLAGPLVAPLRVMSDAADKLAESATTEPLPTSGIAEVAQLADAFAQLRDRLAARTVERERAEAALRAANRNLAALISASPVAVISLSPEGVVKEWNPAAERLLGWRRSEVLERDLSMLLEDRRLPHLPLLHRSSFNGVEIRLRTRQQALIPVTVWSAPLRGEDGSLEGSLVVVADIAERKRLEAERANRVREEAQRAETVAVLDRLAFLAEASGDLSSSLELETTLQRAAAVAVPKLADICLVHLLSETGVIETVARAVADQSVERTLDALQQQYPPSSDDVSPPSQALRRGEPVLIAEITRESLAGIALDEQHLQLLEDLALCSLIAVPLIARDRIFGAMTFASTTPERRYDAASLALATALARRCALAIDNARLYRDMQAALRARETFLSIASHELGGPLARLKAHVDVLQLATTHDEMDAALLNRSVRSVQRATDRLATIIQDLLEVTRWRDGELAIRPVRVDLGKFVREFVANYADRLASPERLSVRVSRGRHLVLVDTSRLEQVCENLLDNAFKYSPDGGKVQVFVRSERGGVLLQVCDAGIGLPSGAEAMIFEPFGRAPNAEEHAVAGMGLGLYICRSIVERHGGRIWAESPGEQQGTTVNVWVPAARA